MDLQIGIFLFTLMVYIPLVGVLLYVWHKYGKGDRKVQVARIIFLVGTILLVGYMLSLK